MPRLGSGGWIPRPRNDSSASPITATGMITVACTITEDAALGRTWVSSTRGPEAFIVFAASTNSRSRSRSVSARTTRIIVGTCATPSAIAAPLRLAPWIAASPTATIRNGNARVRSVSRDTTTSAARHHPAASPSGVPTSTASATASSPTCNDARVPYRIRDSTSRPRSSVPSGNPTVRGSWNGVSKCTAPGSGARGPGRAARPARPGRAAPRRRARSGSAGTRRAPGRRTARSAEARRVRRRSSRPPSTLTRGSTTE